MKVSRRTVIPIFFAIIIILSLLVYLAYGIGLNEFKYAVREQDHHKIPAIAEIFRSSYTIFWILPLLAGISGLLLILRKKEVHITFVAWYVAVFATAGTFLLFWIILVHYLLSTEFIA